MLLSRAVPAVLIALALVLSTVACSTCDRKSCGGSCSHAWPELSGPYLGQTPPGSEAKLFAPGLISTGVPTRDIAITPDGKEIYFSAVLGSYDWYAILVTKEVDGRWTEPVVAPFSGIYKDLEPHISADGGRLMFMSTRPLQEGGELPEDSDIWVMDRAADGWGEPYNLGAPINTELSEFFPSLTADGTLYFTRSTETGADFIWRSRPVDGVYTEPERLGPEVNCCRTVFNATISRDESFLLFSTVVPENTLGRADYYIAFRDAEDNWTGPINMGETVNSSSSMEWSPQLSPDGKYLFFMTPRNRFADGWPDMPLSYADIRRMHNEPLSGQSSMHWVDASFIEGLRPE